MVDFSGYLGESEPPSKIDYIFGAFTIPRSSVFFWSTLSYAFVNLRPLVDKHVLVCPRRCVERYSDLTSEEVIDLWVSGRMVASGLEKMTNKHGSAFGIQDGKDGGQKVFHVHLHVLPVDRVVAADPSEALSGRGNAKEGSGEVGNDFNPGNERITRTATEMMDEAAAIRAFFRSLSNQPVAS